MFRDGFLYHEEEEEGTPTPMQEARVNMKNTEMAERLTLLLKRFEGERSDAPRRLMSLLFVSKFTELGGTVKQVHVQDLAFAVARFIQKGGSYLNYYMVPTLVTLLEAHSSQQAMTMMLQYIDEYGLIKEPKYSRKELHRAIKLSEHALVSSDPTVTSLRTYQQEFWRRVLGEIAQGNQVWLVVLLRVTKALYSFNCYTITNCCYCPW